jgi:hypothetical protein
LTPKILCIIKNVDFGISEFGFTRRISSTHRCILTSDIQS